MLDHSFRGFAARWTPEVQQGWFVDRRSASEPVYLGRGDQTYFGSDDRDVGDRIYGGGGDDVIHGRRGPDSLHGGGGDDLLLGDAGGDHLYGGAGDDELHGWMGHNSICGGTGMDYIVANVGTNEILYKSVTDSLPGNTHDTVESFEPGDDRIDLHKIDAIAATQVNDRFSWIGGAAFSGAAGELRYDPSADLLQADVTGDGVADFEVFFDGIFGVVAKADIIL